MTTVVISQPMYFPWVGFMAQMALADIFIWLDDAAYSKGSFTNRVQLKTSKGRGWLTVPVTVRGLATEIRNLTLAKTCRASHYDTLKDVLKDGPFVADALSAFDAAWAVSENLCDTIIASAMEQAQVIGIVCPTPLRSSAMAVPSKGSRRVLDLVTAVGGTRYITGHGAAGYLDHDAFEAAGIAVEYMDYKVQEWPQSHGDFTPYVSALDMIAHVAPDTRKSYIKPATLAWRSFLDQRR